MPPIPRSMTRPMIARVRLVTAPETYVSVDPALLEAMKKEFGYDRQGGSIAKSLKTLARLSLMPLYLQL